jgi:hypothetical protein
LLANRKRDEKLKLSRQLLMETPLWRQVSNLPISAACTIEPAPLQTCPKCGGVRFLSMRLPAEDAPTSSATEAAAPVTCDTS